MNSPFKKIPKTNINKAFHLSLNTDNNTEKRRKLNKKLAILFTGLSVISFGAAISLNQNDNPSVLPIKYLMIGGGIIYGGISIPFWIASKKKNY